MSGSPFRRLPPVHEILARPELADREVRQGRDAIRRAVRATLDGLRLEIVEGRADPEGYGVDRVARLVLSRLESDRPHLRRVINATGILLHTGLGRAPLAEAAVEAIAEVARGCCNLEFDLPSGERGRRTSGVATLLRELTGAEAAAVVNNNAAATLLALRALAKDREVVVSRGQLVEIGGSYRLPEVFEASGARLREVGTTNKTRVSDYERAINDQTAAFLRVHASNYRIVGFTEEVDIAAIARLAHAKGLLAIDDIGSGALKPGIPPRVAGEPTIAESLAAGADLVLCSGDKLLGGPQCGLLLGGKSTIARLTSDPMMRAFRVDKLTLAALEATLRLALDGPFGRHQIPLWGFLATPVESLRERAERLAERLCRECRLEARATHSTAQLGGGSVPAKPIESVAIRVAPPYPEPIASESDLARRLRLGDPPIVARVHDGAVWLDLRTVSEAEETEVVESLRRLVEVPSPSRSDDRAGP